MRRDGARRNRQERVVGGARSKCTGTLGVSARLVAATGFKPVVGSGNQVPGGFDSHPLPFCLLAAELLTDGGVELLRVEAHGPRPAAEGDTPVAADQVHPIRMGGIGLAHRVVDIIHERGDRIERELRHAHLGDLVWSFDRSSGRRGGGRGAGRATGGAAEGELAPDFALQPPDGGPTVMLSSFRKNLPVALIFGSYT